VVNTGYFSFVLEHMLVVAIWLVGLVVILLVLREFMCWYWKINERLKLQRQANQTLRLVQLRMIRQWGKLPELVEARKLDEEALKERARKLGTPTQGDRMDLILGILEREGVKQADDKMDELISRFPKELEALTYVELTNEAKEHGVELSAGDMPEKEELIARIRAATEEKP